MEPEYIFKYEGSNFSQLWVTKLATLQTTNLNLHASRLKFPCNWTEVPGKMLIFTGGGSGFMLENEVEAIDFRRDFAVMSLPPMHFGRCRHCAVHHLHYLYVVSGLDITQCERYNFMESRWEDIDPIPQSVENAAVVTLESTQCLYVLAVRNEIIYKFIQRLNLVTLTWTLLNVTIQRIPWGVVAFKANESQIHIVLMKNLFVYKPSDDTIQFLKVLPKSIMNICSQSYYSRGRLFTTTQSCPLKVFEVGDLS